MSQQIPEKYRAQLQALAVKASLNENGLVQKFLDVLSEVQTKHPQWPPQKQYDRALFIVYKEIKSQLVSRGTPFYFWAFGLADIKDFNAYLIKEAKTMQQTDPVKARELGYINENGEPTDWRETITVNGQEIPNPNHGKVLTPAPRRLVFGVGRKLPDGKYKLGILSLRGDNVENPPPLGVGVTAKLYLREEQEDRYILYDQSVVKWVPDKENKFAGQESIDKVFNMLYQTFGINLADLPHWIENASYNDFFIALPAILDISKSKSNNVILTVEDMSMMNADAEPLVAIVPEYLSWQTVDLTQGDDIFLVGTAFKGKEEGSYFIKVLGVYKALIE